MIIDWKADPNRYYSFPDAWNWNGGFVDPSLTLPTIPGVELAAANNKVQYATTNNRLHFETAED